MSLVNTKKIIFSDYLTLCKPKVVFLMLVTSWVGMHLATASYVPWQVLLFGTTGIGLAASSAAVFNHLIERQIDIKMARTKARPIAAGRITPINAINFAIALAIIGFVTLYFLINPITAFLTFATFFVYAFFYTIFLKRNTPQNIVIGGISGAMPPLLGWSCVTGSIDPNALLLVLIIFTWTPPHFWALALHRIEDYKKANMPMLPVTHGVKVTKLCILLYTVLLFPIVLIPYLVGMSHVIYLVVSTGLNIVFLIYAIQLYRESRKNIFIKTFNYSILYLLLLFAGLLLDHYFQIKLV